jgi:hypothetical protein
MIIEQKQNGGSMNKTTHIFKPVFGSTWKKLPPVFKKRYINRSFSHDITTVEGTMDISFSKMMSCLMPFFKLFHVLVPYPGNNIPVKVDFRSQIDSNAVFLDRTFYFPEKQPYAFNSCMHIIKDNDVIERMSFGMCWKMHCFYEDQKVVMQHKGYLWKIFGLNIPLPLEILIGKGHAEEERVDDNTYRVTMTLSHRFFGILYRYSGHFTFKKLPI